MNIGVVGLGRLGSPYAHQDHLENFVANQRFKRPPPITRRDGIAAQQIALAATRSLHSGKRGVVE